MNMRSGLILVAGGGTGGHVYPALATIEALRKKGDFRFMYIGGYKGIENKIVPAKKIEYHSLWISGFQRFFTLRNFLFPFKLLVSLMQSWFILKKNTPDVVVGTGGYVSGPLVFVAAKMSIPTLIQEQDSYPGFTTRLLAKYADVVCIPQETVKNYLPKLVGEAVVTGNPVRTSLRLVEREHAVLQWNLDPKRPIIFVFGGSQGAHSINRAISGICEMLIEKYGVQFLWQTGKNNYQQVKRWSVTLYPGIRIFEYVQAMDLAYSAADIIISRAGAITLAELAKVKKPCILIPYPYAAANHQEYNARTVAEKGAAIMVLEHNNFENEMQNALISILEDSEKSRAMSKNWSFLERPDAADHIADQIIRIMKKRYND